MRNFFTGEDKRTTRELNYFFQVSGDGEEGDAADVGFYQADIIREA